MSVVPPLDRIDVEILRLLSNNARLTNKRIAEKVGVAPSTCLERIRKMEESKLIRGYHAEIDVGQLGLPLEALVAVRLQKKSRAHFDEFRHIAATLPVVVNSFHIAGGFDYLLHVAVRDPSHLREFVLDELVERPEVDHVETWLIFDQVHGSALPG